MKHLLNFVPVTKFSGQSSFIYRTILGLLYVMPLLFASYWVLAYWGYPDLIAQLESANKQLEARHKDFQKVVAENHPDKEELRQSSERVVSLYRSMKILEFSWTPLFALVEKLIPDGMRLERIQVRPGPVLHLAISGEVLQLEQLTGFLRVLFEHDRFNNPRILRQTTVGSGSTALQAFEMEMEYLPPREEKP